MKNTPMWKVPLQELLDAVRPADPDGQRASRVQKRLDSLTKPQGSMGRLEELALRLAMAQRTDRPRADRSAVLIFAGDHGVCDEAVSAYGREVTAQLCYAYAAGGGVITALARHAGASVHVVDVGVDHEFGALTGLQGHKVARGTRNLAREPAMTRDEAERALLVGADVVHSLGEMDVLALGEVGIGNTTAAAALASLLTGAPASAVVGRGTGVGDETLRRKVAAVEAATRRFAAQDPRDPLVALVEGGGLELAALAGATLAAASRGIPVLLDGYATGVAALLAVRFARATRDYLIASHRSAERGHTLVLQALELQPLLEWDLRLGEASGAALALPLCGAACVLLRDVATFAEAGVAPTLDPRAIL